jgi:hypothetical protein
MSGIINNTELSYLHLSMCFVELKPAPNNKDIFNAEYIQQCKIKFEPPKHKRDIAQCANCQRYGHTKNYCNLKPRSVKCEGDHLTNKCHQKEIWNDVRCVLCGGTHPANYKGFTVYKGLQKKTGVTYAQITRQNSYTATNIEQDPHINQPLQQTSNIQDLTNMMKSLFEQMETMLNFLTTVLTKLK